MRFVKAQTLGGDHVTRLGSQMYNIAWMRTEGADAGSVEVLCQRCKTFLVMKFTDWQESRTSDL